MAAVVLAAGGGTRFFGAAGSSHKLLTPFRGRPLAWWAVQHAIQAHIGPTWVVTGAVDLAGVVPDGAELLANERWAEGQATSLQVAVAAARAEELDAVVVGLADQPLIPPEAWKAVASCDAPIAVATYQGHRRNPVRLASPVWDLLPSNGDAGARVVMQEKPELVREVACPGDPADIDTKEDLSKWS